MVVLYCKLILDLKMNLNLQLSLWCFAVLFYCSHSQPPHYGYPSFSRHDHYAYHRPPYFYRPHMHSTGNHPRMMAMRPIKSNSYQTKAASKPRAYWNSAGAYPYQYYHPRRQSLLAAPSRTPLKVIYAPVPYPTPQIVFTMPSPQRHAPKGGHTLPKTTSSIDMISSGSDSSNVRYIPVVKKVTHHHVHHIVSSPKSRLHLSEQQNVEQLSDLLRALINKQKTSSSIDAFNLLADGSSQIPIKIDNTEQETKPLEVESEDEFTKNINHEIVFEDEDEDANKKEEKQTVHVIEPGTRTSKKINNKKKKHKKALVYKINPEMDIKENKMITVHDLVKSAAEKSATGKGPYYSFVLGIPRERKSTKTTEQLDDFSENTDKEADDQEYEVDDVDKSNFRATKLKKKSNKTFEKLKKLSKQK